MGDRRRDKEKLRPGDQRDRDRDAVDHRDRDAVDHRDRDRPRKRSRSPDHRRHHTGSPARSPSADRSHRRHSHHHRRSPSPDSHRRKHRREGGDEEGDRDRERHRRRPPSEDADGSIKYKKKQYGSAPALDAAMENAEAEIDPDELEMMKKMGIPVGFDSTKGKPVADNDWSAVRVVTKRQPRQYMNRRGGFNRPLPAEQNR